MIAVDSRLPIGTARPTTAPPAPALPSAEPAMPPAIAPNMLLRCLRASDCWHGWLVAGLSLFFLPMPKN